MDQQQRNVPQWNVPPQGRVPQTNTLAVVALVTSIFVSVVGIVTGHIALHQIKRTKENGRVLAVSALIIGYTELVLTIVIVGVLVAVFSQAGAGGVAGSGASPTAPTAAVVPANANAYGGITFGRGGALVPPAAPVKSVSFADIPAGQPMSAAGLARIGITNAAKPAQIVVYIDLMCPYCQQFEQENAALLKTWQAEGKASVEYRPISILDQLSQGTSYSTRAAAALACVADTAPQDYVAYLTSLYAHKPEENSPGLDNASLVKLAADVGATGIGGCVNAGTYEPFVVYTTNLVIAHGLAGTPTVFVNGQQWQSGTFAAFATPLVAP